MPACPGGKFRRTGHASAKSAHAARGISFAPTNARHGAIIGCTQKGVFPTLRVQLFFEGVGGDEFMLRFCMTVVALLGVFSAELSAQGLRVSTVVYDASKLDAAGREPVVSSSFSLFHTGRVYDYVESLGEVVIFEPASKRFTVLNSVQGVYATIAFAEITRLLDAREPQTQQYIKDLIATQSTDAERAARMLQFQLHPEFENKFDSRSGNLVLSSPSWKYTVSTREWAEPEQVEKYLAYTDWTAKLNCVLHPSSMFPEPRAALNEELRKLDNRMPVVVHLDLRPDERCILRAEHQFVLNLTDRDRSLINGWNEALKSNELKKLPFRGYQQVVLVSQRR